MKGSRVCIALTLAVSLASIASLRADVRTDERTKFQLAGALGKIVNMFGGKGARDGVTSTLAVKGSRKISFNDATGQIVDLSEEKIYDLDMKKKTYKVTTFADLRKKIEDDRQKAEENAKKEAASEPATNEPARDPNQKDVEIDFDVKNTGQSKAMNGFSTQEEIVTVTVREKGMTLEQGGGLVMTADLWLTPAIPQMKELADFDAKYYQQLYGPMIAGASPQDMAAAMAMYPMMKQALGKMTAEGGRISGTPILTTTTFDSVKSADQMAQEQSAKADQPPPSGGVRGRLLGGLASKVVKKDASADQARSTFITTTTEVLKVTTDVNTADVAIPAGFKESK
ncbi:MAG TPA: hypothetical protein VHZ73_08775 [Vicinamibacterales bacterium]|jgi:hypothetical protein|nr:hypothetical protein [Vicinamibacterales bacterium]